MSVRKGEVGVEDGREGGMKQRNKVDVRPDVPRKVRCVYREG